MTYKTIDEWIEHNPNHIGAIPIEICHQIWGTKGKETSMIEDDDDIQEYKKPWVGLTDEEIKAFDTWHDNREEEVGWCNPSEIVAYIEAKLRSKNNV